MKILIHVILSTILSFAIASGAFANAEKDTPDNKTGSGTIVSSDASEDTKEEVKDAKKEKIKETISSYIIDSWKANGDRILKDIDQTLLKNKPDIEDRIEAYKSIRLTLEARRIRNKEQNKTSEISQIILHEFLTHMIDSIDKKIRELSK